MDKTSKRQVHRLLRAAEVCERLGISRATLWRWERAGHLPARRRVGPNSVAWLEVEVEEFIASLPALNIR
jgi:prophage regulatory protein